MCLKLNLYDQVNNWHLGDFKPEIFKDFALVFLTKGKIKKTCGFFYTCRLRYEADRVKELKVKADIMVQNCRGPHTAWEVSMLYRLYCPDKLHKWRIKWERILRRFDLFLMTVFLIQLILTWIFKLGASHLHILF